MDRRRLQMTSHRTKQVAYGIVTVGGAVVVFLMVQCWYYQAHIGRKLGVDLGFKHGSPLVRCGDKDQEVFTIDSVLPGGVFAQAGFTDGDIVVGLSITQFYRILHKQRGRELTVSVVDGGDGPTLNERQVRPLRFRVPTR